MKAEPDINTTTTEAHQHVAERVSVKEGNCLSVSSGKVELCIFSHLQMDFGRFSGHGAMELPVERVFVGMERWRGKEAG